jgi:hypothetical protein
VAYHQWAVVLGYQTSGFETFYCKEINIFFKTFPAIPKIPRTPVRNVRKDIFVGFLRLAESRECLLCVSAQLVLFYFSDGTPLQTRVYLIRVLSGEPNEHFAALIPRWASAKAPAKRSANSVSPPDPLAGPGAHQLKPLSKPPKGGGRSRKSLSEIAAEFPWAAQVSGREGYYYCLWCAEHSGVQSTWGKPLEGAKIVGSGDLKRHTPHKEGKVWVAGNAKHEEAKTIYERARCAESAPSHGVDLPLMSAAAKADFRHTIMAVSKVAYFSGENELPLSLATSLCDLIAQCAPHAETLARVDKYQNRDQVTEIADHLATEVVLRNMVESLRSSPLYGVSFDESTDNGGRQNLVLICSWIDKATFRRKEAFLSLTDLKGHASGEALTAALLDFIDSNCLERPWVSESCRDWASGFP